MKFQLKQHKKASTVLEQELIDFAKKAIASPHSEKISLQKLYLVLKAELTKRKAARKITSDKLSVNYWKVIQGVDTACIYIVYGINNGSTVDIRENKKKQK